MCFTLLEHHQPIQGTRVGRVCGVCAVCVECVQSVTVMNVQCLGEIEELRLISIEENKRGI